MSTTIDTTTTSPASEPTPGLTAIPHIIGGERIAADGRTGAVFNPATGGQTGEVALASAALCALDLLAAEPDRVQRLQQNAELFLSLARGAGLDTGAARPFGIVPVMRWYSSPRLSPSSPLASAVDARSSSRMRCSLRCNACCSCRRSLRSWCTPTIPMRTPKRSSTGVRVASAWYSVPSLRRLMNAPFHARPDTRWLHMSL